MKEKWLVSCLAFVVIGAAFGFLISSPAEPVEAAPAAPGAPGEGRDRVPTGFSPEKADFSVRFQNEVSPYRISSVFLLPGETLELEVSGAGNQVFQAESAHGVPTQLSGRNWRWSAPPKSGIYPLQISAQGGESMRLQAVVMVPSQQIRRESLNGYRIGSYPPNPTNDPNYLAPAGFIEVTEENKNLYLTPHFQLKQFLCKQAGNFPKYLVLQERLLLKLEAVLEEVNRRGYRADTFHIMSGYRTPFYNRAIGNVPNSMHVFGGAADIFIDNNGDGMLDDLNGDGKVTFEDALIMAELVEELHRDPRFTAFIGGLGKYRANSVRGPFIHVDVRGRPARWGG